MKYFISSDIHSYYDIWMSELKKKGYDQTNPNHFLIVCGDLFDRGPDPIKCLQFVNSIPNDRKALIRGNHEDLLMDAIERGDIKYFDYGNGTADTMLNLVEYMRKKEQYIVTNIGEAYKKLKNFDELTQYYDSLVDYYEGKNFICVHGWYPYWVPDWRKNATSKDWNNSRWENGFENGFLGHNEDDKDIIFGHWHCSLGWRIENPNKYTEFEHKNKGLKKAEGKVENFEPYYGINFIGIDACTVHSKKVNVIVIVEDD